MAGIIASKVRKTRDREKVEPVPVVEERRIQQPRVWQGRD